MVDQLCSLLRVGASRLPITRLILKQLEKAYRAAYNKMEPTMVRTPERAMSA